MRNIQYFYLTDKKEKNYIEFMNVHYSISGIAEDKKISCINGLSWQSNDNEHFINFENKKVSQVYIPIEKNKIIILYQGISHSFPAPNNLVIYTPTGEIERILSTPILPTGKQGAGFLEIHGLENWDKNTIPEEFKNGLYVVIWEHERSEWVYSYYFNPDTYEFLFFNRSRY